MKNKLFMKNLYHVLMQEKNRMLDSKSETFVDLMLESKDSEFSFLSELIDEAFSMTLSGTKYNVNIDENVSAEVQALKENKAYWEYMASYKEDNNDK